MNRPCPWRSDQRAIENGRVRWVGLALALLVLGALVDSPFAVAPAHAQDGGIEIGADPSAPPVRTRPDSARVSTRRPAVPVPPQPPQPPDVDAELERARERMAHEQARLEEERERAQEELDRAQERVDRQRDIRSRGGERGQRGEIVRMGSDVVIEPGEIVTEVVVIGGDLDVDGEVDGDAVAVGGDVTIGPGARVSGDAVSVGGRLTVAPGAIIEGDEVEVGTGAGILRGLGGGWNRDHDHGPRHSPVGRSLLALLILLFIGWLAAVLAGERLGALAESLSQDWLRALLTGVLVLVLWLPAVFLSAITVIGIPVAIFLIFAVPLLIFVGYLIGAMALGRRVSIGLGRATQGPLQSIIFGILVIGLLGFIGHVLGLVGFLGPFGVAFRIVSYALFSFAATSGLGVIALAIFHSRFRSRAAMTPPAPPPPPAPLPPAPPDEPGETPGGEPTGPHPGEPSQAPA
jgi:hypothetical protein